VWLRNPEDYCSSILQLFSDMLNFSEETEIIGSLIDERFKLCVLSALTKTSITLEIVKFIDLVILKLNSSGFDNYEQQIHQILNELLNSDSLFMVFGGVKLIHILIKHQLAPLIITDLIHSITLFTKFKWANIIHSVITESICSVISLNDDCLTQKLLKEGKLPELIIDTLTETNIHAGYTGHIRLITNSLMTHQVPHLSIYPQWATIISTVQQLNEINQPYNIPRPPPSRRTRLLKPSGSSEDPSSKFLN